MLALAGGPTQPKRRQLQTGPQVVLAIFDVFEDSPVESEADKANLVLLYQFIKLCIVAALTRASNWLKAHGQSVCQDAISDQNL